MKNKKFQPPFALLFVGLFLSVIQISGCDSTKGSNIPTSPSGNTLTLSASPSTIAADGADFSVITATVTGNSSGTVEFTTSIGTLSASSVSINSAGKAQVTLTSSTAGIATVRATSGTLSASTTVTIGLGSIVITGTGNVANASPSATESTEITFTVKDVNSTTIAGIEVTLATPTTSNSGVTASWSDTSPNTNTSGVATSFLSTNSQDLGVAVTVTITASATGAGSASAQITFDP